jgi:DNA helicase-2/ATP-dependent DNA helicase PcrA
MLKERELIGHYACPTRRKAGLSVQEAANTFMNKGNLVRDVVTGCLVQPKYFKSFAEAEKMVDAEMEAAYENGEYMSRFHMEAMKTEVLKSSKRFIDWFLCQTATSCETAVQKQVKCGTLDVLVTPAWIRRYKEDGVDVVEVAKLSTKRLYMSTAGRTPDTSIKQSLQIYSLIQYGKTLLPEGGRIRAVYYFTRKKDTDSDFSAEYTEKEFVASVTVPYDPKAPISSWEERYLESAKTFAEGRTCTKAACDDCEFQHLCSYVKPPVAIEKKAEVVRESSYKFTEEQTKIIAFKTGCARANCGAGAGKTTVVVYRVISLLCHGVKGDEILLITFTNTACREMLTRLKRAGKYAGIPIQEINKVKITTFNGLGDEILSRYYQELGYSVRPVLADKVDKLDLILDLFKDDKVDGFDYRSPMMDKPNYQGAYAKTLHLFSLMKKKNITSYNEFIREFPDFGSNEEVVCQLIAQYNIFVEEMKKRGLFEYADQTDAIFRILKKNMFMFAEDYHFAHIIVDEFQDSNDLQLDIIKAVCDTDWYESLLVVGDDSQAIFGFNGTSPYNIINFPKLIGMEVTDFYLVDNYRSTPEIIGAANYVNALNKNRIKKNLISKRESGKKPVLKGFDSDKSELLYNASQIERLVKVEGVNQSDICYIARTKAELGKMQTELTNRGIVSVIDVSTSILKNSRVRAGIELARFFLDNMASKSLLTYLDAVLDNEFMSLGPKKGQYLLESNIVEFSRVFDEMDEDRKIQYFLSLLGVLDDGDDMYTSFLVSITNHARHNLKNLLSYVVKQYDYETDLEGRFTGDFDAVKLTTAHSSKGLEWNHVFISLTKYDEAKRLLSEDDIEEDRRLIFVAMTRARDELTVTSKVYADGGKDVGGSRLHRYFSELRRYDGFDYESDEVPVRKKTVVS